MNRVSNRQAAGGFTLIELVVVIAILGILAAVALPKFIDISTEAQAATTQGIAGALGSASSLNYGARKVAPTKGVAIGNCTAVANALQGGLPAGYTITSLAVLVDTTVTCTLTGPSGSTATFPAIGIT